MQLPNKITTFEESILSKFAVVLRIVKKNETSVLNLYNTVKNEINDVETFLEVLDCLYALGKIDFNESERTIYYVGNVD